MLRLPGVVLHVAAPDHLHQPPQRNGNSQRRHRQHHRVDSPLPQPPVNRHVQQNRSGGNGGYRQWQRHQQGITEGKRAQRRPFNPQPPQDSPDNEQGGVGPHCHVVPVGDVGEVQNSVNQSEANGPQGNNRPQEHPVHHQAHLYEGQKPDNHRHYHYGNGRVPRCPGQANPSCGGLQSRHASPLIRPSTTAPLLGCPTGLSPYLPAGFPPPPRRIPGPTC